MAPQISGKIEMSQGTERAVLVKGAELVNFFTCHQLVDSILGTEGHTAEILTWPKRNRQAKDFSNRNS